MWRTLNQRIHASDLGFGDLNQIEKPNTAITYDPTDTTVMGALRNVLKDQYNNKAFENVGQLKGIVLRVEPGKDDSANSVWASLKGNDHETTQTT